MFYVIKKGLKMLLPYLKNLHISLAYLLSFSFLTTLSMESGLAMEQEKIEENAIPPRVLVKNDWNLDWDVVAQKHEKTAVRYEQLLQDMRVEDIPSTKKSALTYAQRILKHRELSTLCEEIGVLSKKGLDISDKKNEVEQKLTELYGPLKIEFQPLGLFKKLIDLRKISDNITLCLGCGSAPNKKDCPDPHDKVFTVNSDSETNPDIIANFFSPSFVSTIQQLFKGKKFEKIIVENHSPKFLLYPYPFKRPYLESESCH